MLSYKFLLQEIRQIKKLLKMCIEGNGRLCNADIVIIRIEQLQATLYAEYKKEINERKSIVKQKRKEKLKKQELERIKQQRERVFSMTKSSSEVR